MREARYSAVAILLHWAIAAAIIANVALGWWMHEAFDEVASQARAIAAFQLHKSLGLSVLVLSLLRLLWRVLHTPPPMPPMPAWERLAARATHWAFYGLMLAIPLSGWLYVSTQWRGDAPLNVPTLWFGLFEVPHLFGLNEAAPATREALAGLSLEAHEWLAWGTMALLLLHVGAALKHHLVDRDAVLAGMLPAVHAPGGPAPERDPWRSALLRGGSLAILAGALAFGWALLGSPGRTVPGEARVGDLPGSDWSVLPGSEILFSGSHAGVTFSGRFTRWRAGIRFDPQDPATSRIVAEIETGSARDGDPLHEETLPQREWFNVAEYPLAHYRSEGIRALGDGRFELRGTLTIKGRPLPVAPLTLSLGEDRLRIHGQTTISRRAADLGMESDPRAEYVSDEILVELRLQAEPA